MLLELKKVAKFYGNKLVFKGVSLSLAPGSILMVAGPNGAGKSTLLKIMAGLCPPSAGKADLRADPEKMGYLGHHTFIYPQLTGLENLRFWARLYGVTGREKDLMAALDRVEMGFAAREQAGRYSRGMAQRLALARVFLLSPDLILLDEPGTGLDKRSHAILTREIDEARERGAGLAWVSHHLDRDLHMADQVLALESKGVGYYGPAAEYTAQAVES